MVIIQTNAKKNIGSKAKKKEKCYNNGFLTYGYFSLYQQRKTTYFFSKDLILELKLCLTWHDLLTPFRHEVSKAYFPEQITILDPKQNSQKNGVLTAEHLMTASLKPFYYLTLLKT